MMNEPLCVFPLFTGDVVLLMVRLQWKVMEARKEPINKNTPQKTHRKEQ